MQEAPRAEFMADFTAFLERLSDETLNQRPATAALALIECQELLLREKERPHVAAYHKELQAKGMVDTVFAKILEQDKSCKFKAALKERKAEALAALKPLTATRSPGPAAAALAEPGAGGGRCEQEAMMGRLRSASARNKFAAKMAALGCNHESE